MAIGYMGRSGASMANYYASKSDSPYEEGVTPLKPGEDPLAAIDAETRDAIVNWETAPASERTPEKSFADRLVGGLFGAGIGAVVGFLLLNGVGRGRYRAAWHARPMNAQASLVWAGIGAAIGGISGFARGRSPLDVDPKERVVTALGSKAPVPGTASAATTDPITGALTVASTPSHSAFSSLYGG
jgi:hypothetical protein